MPRRKVSHADGVRQGRPLQLPEPEPWPEPVDGTALAEELAATFPRFVVLSRDDATACALWVLHTYSLDAAQVSPLLAITSPTKRCGKTTLLTVLGALVKRPLLTSNITSSALFRAIEHAQPTLLIDEGDTFFAEREELQALLNASHVRNNAYVLRNVKVADDFEPRMFSTWCAKAVALIERRREVLRDTLRDRSIEIRLQRRAPHERVERLRVDRIDRDLEPLRRKLERWALDNLEPLRDADPQVPEELDDRAADNWRPLLAIADAIGGVWPDRAREAARRLSGAPVRRETEPALQILADVQPLFEGRDFVLTRDLVEALRQEPRWASLTPRRLAELLEPFGIRPIHREAGNGYRRQDFEDAWGRYVMGSRPPEPTCGEEPRTFRNLQQADMTVPDGHLPNLQPTFRVFQPSVPAESMKVPEGTLEDSARAEKARHNGTLKNAEGSEGGVIAPPHEHRAPVVTPLVPPEWVGQRVWLTARDGPWFWEGTLVAVEPHAYVLRRNDATIVRVQAQQVARAGLGDCPRPREE